jgi:hypothetical protein
MIVIPSHDRIDLLVKMVRRLCEIDLNGHEVLIVDTNSDSEYYQETVHHIAPWFLETHSNFKFVRKDYKCRDSGAFIHAYMNYPSERYIFLHDSVHINNPNFIVEMDSALDSADVVPVFNFGFGYDSYEQQVWAEQKLPPIESYPHFGIIGPMFGVHKHVLDKMPSDWLIEPTNKAEGCGMERRWAVMFHLIGASVKFLDYIPPEDFWIYWEGGAKYSSQLQKYAHRVNKRM